MNPELNDCMQKMVDCTTDFVKCQTYFRFFSPERVSDAEIIKLCSSQPKLNMMHVLTLCQQKIKIEKQFWEKHVTDIM
jgi:hypothetical protein